MKKRTYINYAIKLLLTTLISAVLGLFLFYLWSAGEGNIREGMGSALEIVRQRLLEVESVLFLLSVLAGEGLLFRLASLCKQVMEAEDEEGDDLEYRMEKISAAGAMVSAFLSVLSMTVLSLGYSLSYIRVAKGSFLPVCFVFIANQVYQGFWQIRYVKKVQKVHPEKKGEPGTRKFHKEWMDSCDEAEKNQIYQGAWHSYMVVGKTIPILLVITMVSHLFLETGIMAVLMVGIIGFIQIAGYTMGCLKMYQKKGPKKEA